MTRCQACLSHHEPGEPCPAAYGFGTAFAELPVVHASAETQAAVQSMTAKWPPAPANSPTGTSSTWSPEISPAIERWQRRPTWLGRFIFAPRPKGYVRRVMLRELWCALRRRHRWQPVEGFTVPRCSDCWRWRSAADTGLPPPAA